LAARGKELSRLWLGKDGDEAVVLMAEKSDANQPPLGPHAPLASHGLLRSRAWCWGHG